MHFILAKDLLFNNIALWSVFKEKKALYIGCNTGKFLAHSKEFFGVDISFSYLLDAKKITQNTICANASNLPLKNSSFQITYSSMFEHIDEKSAYKVVSEMFRVTVNSGFVVIKCSISHFFPSLFEKIFKKIVTENQKLEVCGIFYLGKWSNLKFLRLITHLFSIFLPFTRESFVIIVRKYFN